MKFYKRKKLRKSSRTRRDRVRDGRAYKDSYVRAGLYPDSDTDCDIRDRPVVNVGTILPRAGGLQRIEEDVAFDAVITPEEHRESDALTGSAEASEVDTLCSNMKKLCSLDKKTYDERSFPDMESHGLFCKIKQARTIASKYDQLHRAVQYTGADSQTFQSNIEARVEDLVALIVNLMQCTTVSGAMSALALYRRTITAKPLLGCIKDVLVSWFSSVDPEPARHARIRKFLDEHIHAHDSQTWTNQSADVDQWMRLDASFRSFLDQCKNGITNWKTFKETPAARQFCSLISIIVTLGFLPSVAEEGFRINGFKLFDVKAWDRQENAADFFEAVCETLLFFIDRGYNAVVTQDSRSLLYTDSDAMALDTEYAKLMAALPLVENNKFKALPDGIRSVHDLDARLDALERRIIEATRDEKKDFMRNVLGSKLANVSRLRSAINVSLRESNVRERPFAVMIVGPSSVAKTTLVNVIVKTVLEANGFPSGKDSVITMNTLDKYQTEYKTHHTGVIMDDFANSKVETYDGAPTDHIIKFINNMPVAALKAAVDEKGGTMICPKMFAVTTNVKHLLAHHFSNEPASILRRFDVVVEVKLKKSHIAPDGGPDRVMMTKDPDAWHLNVQRVEIIRKSVDSAGNRPADGYKFVNLLENCRVLHALEFLRLYSQRFFRFQKSYVRSLEAVFENPMCSHGFPSQYCSSCNTKHVVDALDCKSDEEIIEAAWDVNYKVCIEAKDASLSSESDPDGYLDQPMQCQADDVRDPTSLACEPVAKPRASRLRRFFRWRRRYTRDKLGTHLQKRVLSAHDARNPDFDLEHEFRRFQTYHPWLYGAYDQDKGDVTMSQALEIICKEQRSAILGIAGASALVSILTIVRMRRSFFEPQGQAQFTTSTSDDMWKRVEYIEPETSKASQSITAERLANYVYKHSGVLKLIKPEGGCIACSIVPLQGATWLAPAHMFERFRNGQVTIEVDCTRRDAIGKKFRANLLSKHMYFIPNADLVVLRVHAGGDVPDLLKFISLSHHSGKREALCVRKDVDTREQIVFKTQLQDPIIATVPGMVRNDPVRKRRYLASEYIAAVPTDVGQCMTACVSYTKKPSILGFHTAGKNGTRKALACLITAPVLRDAIDVLDARCGLGPCSSGMLNSSMLGKDTQVTGPAHPKHPINWIPQDAYGAVRVYGSVDTPRATFRSSVEVSPISDTVSEIMGLPRLHGPPPTTNTKKYWRKELLALTDPAWNVDAFYLHLASIDLERKYRDGILKSSFASELGVISLDQALAGLDGVKFLDALNLKTSVGYPVKKPKKGFIQPSDRLVEGITRPLDLDPAILQEMDKMRKCFLRKERYNTIFSMSLKDTPTKIGKDKLRLFASAQVAFTILVRRYFLSIVRVIQLENVNVESAVGMNYHSCDWKRVADHILDGLDDEPACVGSDFGSFDKKMDSSVNMEGFGILIRVCEMSGFYDEDDILIMYGLATEICYPMFEYDGLLLSFLGSNPSGHPLTVTSNDLVNKLEHRTVFYEILHEGTYSHMNNVELEVAVRDGTLRFDKFVNFVSYGDDAVQGIRDKSLGYNHTTISEKMKLIGRTYTMADKTAASVPFVPFSQIDFLKRRFVWDKQIYSYRAPIEMDSISKLLHCVTNRRGNDVLPEVQAADALKTAVREFFHYGQDEYERRLPQIREVAEKEQLLGLVEPALLSWSEQVALYCDSAIDTCDEYRDENLTHDTLISEFPNKQTNKPCKYME